VVGTENFMTPMTQKSEARGGSCAPAPCSADSANETTMSTELQPRRDGRVRSSELVRRFTDWADAFSVCREMDKPITVSVPVNDMMEVARIFPSGRCKHLRYVTPNDQAHPTAAKATVDGTENL
jgi:hypothetical protein